MDIPEDEAILITAGQITAMISTPYSTFSRWMSRGQFPQSIRINGKNERWVRQEVLDWIQTKLDERVI